MSFLFFSLFFEIKDANTLVNLNDNFDYNFSLTLINYYNIPELTGFRIKGNKIFIYDFSILGFSYYKELMIGLGKNFFYNNIEIKFIPYFIMLNAADIKIIGATEELRINFKYLNFGGGFNIKNLFFIFKNEIPTIQEIYISYKIDNFFQNFKISYSPVNNLDFSYGIKIITHPLCVSLGFSSNPLVPVFGVGVIKGNMQFNFGFVSHPLLGFTENFTITF